MPTEANQSKSGRGGKRAGAGRKPSTIKGIAKRLPSSSAEVLLAEIKANQRLVDMANGDDPWLAFKVIQFLWEQARGKAKQAIVGGEETDSPVKVVLIGAKNVG